MENDNQTHVFKHTLMHVKSGYRFTLLLVSFCFAGCASQPTAYHVVDSLDYKKGYMNGFYKLGVTEEIVKPNQVYKVTVKLDSGSSSQRAKDMLLFHAAKLTLASNGDKFVVTKLHATSWCGRSSGSGANTSYLKNYGPVIRAFIRVVKQGEVIPVKVSATNIYDALAVEKEKSNQVHKTLSSDSIKMNKDEHESVCLAKSF